VITAEYKEIPGDDLNETAFAVWRQVCDQPDKHATALYIIKLASGHCKACCKECGDSY